ncbi:MAG TPA: hypothetical protein VLE73_04980 [Candidatus Saccharimonadales bacterium]|nr:hypothetical protein [Candidatus Saccharimonadales bacterium]
MQQPSTLRYLPFILAGIVGIGVLWVVIVSVSRMGKQPIIIVASPADSRITIDGKAGKTGTVYVSTGKHTIKATRQYFSDTSVTFNTADIKKSNDKKVYVILPSNSPEGDKYIQTHSEEGSIRGYVGGKQYNDTVDTTFQKYPVLAQLPINNIDYTIDYSVDEKKNVTFEITLQPAGTKPGSALYIQQLKDFKAEALDWLKKQGVDTTKATISITPDPDNQSGASTTDTTVTGPSE